MREDQLLNLPTKKGETMNERTEALRLLGEMLQDVHKAKTWDDARHAHNALFGAARMAYRLGAIEMEKVEAYDAAAEGVRRRLIDKERQLASGEG